ncbi:MAG: hypothetical protein H7066_03415 [Cytophagaceae bacterium]|nr:hypothetical protein [Gemmatimonadaceae bacterium]
MRSLGGAALLACLAAASPLEGQGVILQLRPRAGDTLRVRLDQTIEISRSNKAEEEAPEPADAASLVILARIAVEVADLEGSQVMALTDSVRITSSDAYATSPTLQAARALQGQRFRFRVQPDGGTTMPESGAFGGPVLGTLFSQLPATLPREKLVPGATWVRAVEFPLAAAPDGRGTATLNATFRFDSLSRSGEYAMLSVRGRLIRAAQMPGGAKEGYVQTSGDVTGKIMIDLRRGWIADARSVVTLQSLVTSSKGPATRVRVKITQWMRVL